METSIPAAAGCKAGRALYRAALRQPTAVANTEAMRAAVFRLRYDVYVEELGYADYDTADHDRRWITDELDEHEGTTLFTVGPPEQITGTVRVTVYRPGEIPPAVREEYSLDRFGDIDRRTICVGTKMMIRRTNRGGLAMLGLVTYAAEQTVSRYGAEMTFLDCAPRLIRAYRKLGLRFYGGRLIRRIRGAGIPMVCIHADLGYLCAAGSPWYHSARELLRRGALPTADFMPLVDVLEQCERTQLDDAVIATEVERVFGEGRENFLTRLPQKARESLPSGGFVLDIEPGALLVKTGCVERDIYVVLSGAFEIVRAGVPIAVRGPGHILGEIAFFRQSGKRTADVRALHQSRVLVLRQRFLQGLEKTSPSEAMAVYKLLCEIMAERLADVLSH